MNWDLILLIVYPLVLLGEVLLLYFAVKKPKRTLWLKVFGLELLSALGALGLADLFEQLPGYGMMPGLTWLGEYLSSMAAAVGYGVLFLVSFFLWVRQKRRG